jgi:hypothetical protein
MFVRYSPSTINVAQTDRQTKIEPFRPAVRSRFGTMHRRNRKGDILARSNAHLGNVKRNRVARPGKEQPPRPLVGFDSFGLKWRRNVEHQDVGRMILENPSDIFPTHRSGPGLNHTANRRFLFRVTLHLIHAQFLRWVFCYEIMLSNTWRNSTRTAYFDSMFDHHSMYYLDRN